MNRLARNFSALDTARAPLSRLIFISRTAVPRGLPTGRYAVLASRVQDPSRRPAFSPSLWIETLAGCMVACRLSSDLIIPLLRFHLLSVEWRQSRRNFSREISSRHVLQSSALVEISSTKVEIARQDRHRSFLLPAAPHLLQQGGLRFPFGGLGCCGESSVAPCPVAPA